MRVEKLIRSISLVAGIVTLALLTTLVFAVFREFLWAAVNATISAWDSTLGTLGFTTMTTIEALIFIWWIQAVLYYAIKQHKRTQLTEIKKENES